MPKLPSEADFIGSRPGVAVGGGVTAARPEAVPQLGAQAHGYAALARAAGEGAGDIATVELRERQRNEDVQVEDAFNKLRAQQLDLSVGEQNGFQNLKGGDAANRPVLTEWGKRFDEQSKQIEAGLQDPGMKERFRRRAQIARADFAGDIMRHVAREKGVYAEATFKGTIDLETRLAMSNWNDPSAIGTSLERVTNAVARESERHGWAENDPQRQALGMHAVSSLHAAVITQALQNGDPAYAQKYFEKTKESIDPSVVKTLGSQVEQGVQKQLAAGYQSQFLDARDDPKQLDALAKAVTGDKTLDDERRNILLGRILTRSDVLTVRAEREEQTRLRLIQRGIDQVNKVTLAGFEPTAEQMLPLIAQARGTELEGEVRNMVAVANATKVFRLALPQQQEAMISKLEIEARKDPTKFDITVLDRFKRIQTNQQQAIQQDPVTFATRQGLLADDNVAAKPLDLTNLAQSGEQLQARFDLGRAMTARYQAPFKPLTKEEADALSGTLRTSSVDQKRALFGQLVTAAGNDFEGYKALFAQIAPDDPVTAHAGIMAGRARLATDAGFPAQPGKAVVVADLILRGQQVLHPNRKEDGSPEKGKLWPMPKDDEFAKVFQSYERDAFAGNAQARNGFLQTAKAIYAARAIEAGDSTGVLESSRWDEAMKLATGGIERWNGKSILMPWGYSRGQFKDELYRRIDDIESAARLAPGVTGVKLRDMPLEAIGDGRYLFRAGDGLMVDKEGRPLVVDFNVSAAYRPSGTRPPQRRADEPMNTAPNRVSFFRGGPQGADFFKGE